MGSSRAGLYADHDLLQGDNIPFALGFCDKQARVALQEHRREKLGSPLGVMLPHTQLADRTA